MIIDVETVFGKNLFLINYGKRRKIKCSFGFYTYHDNSLKEHVKVMRYERAFFLDNRVKYEMEYKQREEE